MTKISKVHDPELKKIIHDTIVTFRIGAVLCVDDIRFASYVDGHSLNAVDGRIIHRIINADGTCQLLDPYSTKSEERLWRRIK